jgi:hypothetical protein
MNKYLLMLQGGQEACLTIDAWDMGHAIRIAKDYLADGWGICKIRAESGYEYHIPAAATPLAAIA